MSGSSSPPAAEPQTEGIPLGAGAMSPLRSVLAVGVATAAIALGAQWQIPAQPVPFTLQTFFILLAGFLLGARLAGPATFLYLVIGALGAPVFAGGEAGTATLFGPTGGFLISFPGMALLASAATQRPFAPPTWRLGLACGSLASFFPFFIGLPWLAWHRHLSFFETLDRAFWPFLPAAALKLVAALLLARLLGRLFPRRVEPDQTPQLLARRSE